MDQSAPIPASFIHKHPMRCIALNYMPGETALTTEDEQLLEKYLQLHDFEYQLLKKSEELFKSFNVIDKQVKVLREGLDKIKSKLDDTIAMADKLSGNSYIPAEANMEKIKQRNAATIKELASYHQRLNELYKELKYQQEILTGCVIASEEGSEKIYKEYNSISAIHNKHYTSNTIDIVSLDDDFQNYLITQNLYEERRNSFIDSCNTVLNSYTILNLETNLLYGVWNEFLKRCELMQVVAALQSSKISSSAN